MHIPTDSIANILRQITFTSEEDDLCWIWHGVLAGNQPRYFVTIDRQHYNISVYRVVLTLLGLPLPRRIYKRCGTKRCVRPSHACSFLEYSNLKAMVLWEQEFGESKTVQWDPQPTERELHVKSRRRSPVRKARVKK